MPATSSLALAVVAIAFSSAVPVNHERTPVATAVVWPAPVGHRQPTERDLPPSVRRDERAPIKDQNSIDKDLQICRGC